MKSLRTASALSNLFELATDDDLQQKPDAVYTYGVPDNVLDNSGTTPTVYFDAIENDMHVAVVPNLDELGYFGYLRKRY